MSGDHIAEHHAYILILSHLLQLEHSVLDRTDGDRLAIRGHILGHSFVVDGYVLGLEDTEEKLTIRRSCKCLISIP